MMDHPSVIQFETISACNAHCSFCPHSTMGRVPQRMDWATIRSIVSQVKDFKDSVQYICPFLTNEPFSDVRMPEIVKLINCELQGVRIEFFTNGSLFSDATLSAISQASINCFNVSLHHPTKAAYEAELGIDFGKTVESVHRLVKSGIAPVKLLRVPAKADPDEDASFLAFCAAEFPNIPSSISYRYNWKGDIDSFLDFSETLDIVCPRHRSMTITVSGEVALCCLDQNAEYSLGNIHTKSLLDIYNGEKALRYRTKTKRCNTPCNKCNMI